MTTSLDKTNEQTFTIKEKLQTLMSKNFKQLIVNKDKKDLVSLALTSALLIATSAMYTNFINSSNNFFVNCLAIPLSFIFALVALTALTILIGIVIAEQTDKPNFINRFVDKILSVDNITSPDSKHTQAQQ